MDLNTGLSVDEAAQALNVSRRTVYALIASGELESFTLPTRANRRRIPRSALRDYVVRARKAA